MKAMRYATVMVAGFALATAGAVGQTKTPAKGTAKAPAKAGYNRALLTPAALKAQAPAEYEAKFATTKGDFVVKVTRAWSPLGADRFFNLVKSGFYDQVTMFRVVRDPRPFVVQFGISAHPQVSRVWETAVIQDDAVKASNKRGFITFATGGPNTRTTQVFISLGDNARLDGMGFSPFGEITQGMDVVDQLYSGYGESPTNRQGEIAAGGNAFLAREYPKLDKILKATVVPPAPPSAAEKALTQPPAKTQPAKP